MDDLNAFKVDLARIREGDDSRGQTLYVQDIQEASLADQDEHTESSLSLGRALVVLFQARPSALRKALKDEGSDGVLSRMLQTLTRHVEIPTTEDGDENVTSQIDRMREVYVPMLGKLLKKGGENEKAVAYILLDWLLKAFKHRDVMQKAIAVDLECLHDKKLKLAVLMALNFTIVEQSMSMLKPGKRENTQVLPLPGGYMVEYTRLLVNIVNKDSLLQSDGTKSMTKLTATALDLALMIIRFLAESVMRSIQEQKAKATTDTATMRTLIQVQEQVNSEPYQWFLSAFKSVPRITKEMQAWTPKTNSLKHAALKDITEMAIRFNNSHSVFRGTTAEHDDMNSMANTWTVIMPSMSTSTASLPLQSCMKSIQSHIAARDQYSSAHLISCGMMLGYVDPTISLKDLLTGKVFPVSDADLLSKVFDFTNAEIVGHNSTGRYSAYAIQRQLTMTMDEEQIRAQLPKMLALLDHETDEVTKAVAEMVANSTMAFPAVILPEFINRLKTDHKNVMRIRNILSIVDETAEQGFLTSPLDTEANMMRDILIDILLSKLNDSDLKVRMTSSHIASNIDPVKLVQKLVPNLSSKDEKARSSAELALVECLLAQRKDRPASEGLIALVDAIRRTTVPHTSNSESSNNSKIKPIKSPGQLLAQQRRSSPSPAPSSSTSAPSMNAGPDEETLRLDRVARVIHKWAEAVPPTTWPLYIDRLVAKTYGSPSDQNLIRVWKEISPSIASSIVGMTSLLESVLSILEQQGTLTPEELEQAVEASDEAIDDLRYARLSPLLILKTIPPEGYTNLFQAASEESRILSQRALTALKARTQNSLEFNHVKQLAFALMPSMFPNSSLEQIHTQMSTLLGTAKISYDDLKSWVISLYNWITTWTIQTATPEQLKVDLSWLGRILRDALLPILAIPMPTDANSSQALYKLQLGVMDALSQLILAIIPYYSMGTPIGSVATSTTSTTPKIQEITGDEVEEMQDATASPPLLDNAEANTKPSGFFALLLTAMLEKISQPSDTHNFEQIGVAVCMANSLILTMQRLFQAASLSSTAAATSTALPSATTLPKSWIPSVLLDLVTPTLTMVIHKTLEAHETPSSSSSSLQSNVEGVPGFDMLLTGCFQVLYTGVNAVAMMATHPATSSAEDGGGYQQNRGTRTTNRATDQGMMDAVVAGFESEQVNVAVAALKLLGTLAATGTVHEAGLLTPGNLAKIRRGLGWLGSAEVKAQDKMPEIAPLLDKMWEMVA